MKKYWAKQDNRDRLSIMGLLLLASLCLSGCMTGYISAENTAAAEFQVLDRHDRLLEANPPLNPDGSVDTAKLESEKRTSELLRRVYQEALKEGKAKGNPVPETP